MKKIILTLIAAAAFTLLIACHTSAPAVTGTPSWRAYCAAHSLDATTAVADAETINDYLDTWCGSADEELSLTR